MPTVKAQKKVGPFFQGYLDAYTSILLTQTESSQSYGDTVSKSCCCIEFILGEITYCGTVTILLGFLPRTKQLHGAMVKP